MMAYIVLNSDVQNKSRFVTAQMSEIDHSRYRAKLLAELEALKTDDAARAADRATVQLDQQMVGRLSRMDAIQQQAMAQATSARKKAQILRIEAALRRYEDGEYGFCTDCGEEIAAGRLDHDPAVPRCVTCAAG